MANNKTASGKKPLSKEQIREMERRKGAKQRRDMLVEGHNAAVANSRERLNGNKGDYFDDGYDGSYAPAPAAASRAPEYGMSEVDHRFAVDVQKMKFCRKPVGFLMMIVFILAIAVVAISFIPFKNSIPMVDQFTAMFTVTEAKPSADNNGDGEQSGEEAGEETEQEGEEESASNAAEDGTEEGSEEGSGETGEGSGEESSEGEGEKKTDKGVYYKFSDPVYGWISFIAKKFNFELNLGSSEWYDAQISKAETGMEDKIAAYLIMAFPAAIILYLIFALALTIKTFICWASRDRRIYRHTSIECIIMLLLALVTAFGGFACTVGIESKMDFGGIVNYLAGMFTGAGGFTVGYGMLLMIALPLIGLILSFFLLEKKLRSREITQPIILYKYKESYRKAQKRTARQ